MTFVIRPFVIPSLSMAPTLQRGDVVFVSELAYHIAAPVDGDVAVFKPPFASKVDFVKRVVGSPGDRIGVRDGALYVNGRRTGPGSAPIDYAMRIADYGIQIDDGDGWERLDAPGAEIPPRADWQAPDRVPKGYYVVMGDNRNNSDDSHIWGFVPRQNFAGRAFFVLWPLLRVHVLN